MPTLPSIRTSIENNQSLVIDSFARQGIFRRDKRGRLVAYTGGFSVVYPFEYNNEVWAFRCWHADLGNLRGHFLTLSSALSKLNLPYFCSFTYVDEGIVVEGKKYPTTRMKWIDGKNLKEYICIHKNDKNKLKILADNFVKMITMLHKCHISHGDLQHGNILVDDNDNLFLIDYDSVYVPELQGEADIIKGLKGYQHPKRGDNLLANEKVDYFSELIIYLSILAIAEKSSLVEKYQVEDSEQLLFSFEDFKDLENSQVYVDLMQLGGLFPILLKILSDYLNEDDICNLEPFTTLVDKYAKEPKIKSFRAPSDCFVIGQSYKLTWEVNDASRVYLNGKIVPATMREYKVHPLNIGNESYELKVENGLKTAVAQLSVNVVENVRIEVGLSLKKLRKRKMQASLLQWDVQNAKKVTLETTDGDSELIPLNGEKKCSPNISTTYNIKAIALDGITEVSKSVSIGVFAESEVIFKADKTFTFKEVPVTLSWNVKNAKSVSLENETVPLVGKKVVTTDKEKCYVLEVEDEFGTKQVPLTIKTIPLPQIKTVLLPLPKLEKTVQVQHNIPAPKVELNIQMQELSADMQGVNVNLNPAAIKFAKLNSLHPLSIKIGSSLRSRIKTAIDIITNKVEHLKFESDEK